MMVDDFDFESFNKVIDELWAHKKYKTPKLLLHTEQQMKAAKATWGPVQWENFAIDASGPPPVPLWELL